MTSLSAVKAQQQRMWATGDFSVIAWNTVFPGELLCEAVDLRAGERVLDVACGSGNVALAAARRNCAAVGIDFVPELIERARARAAAERVPAQFGVADCEAIPFADGSFDAVLSVFGSMFGPDQQKSAAELLRVCRPGGRIGMANWTPEGFWGQAFALGARFRPPPPGLRPVSEWGTQQRLRELFGAGIESMHFTARSALFRYRDSAHWLEVFTRYLGPVATTLQALDEAGRAAYRSQLDALLNRFNLSGDHTLVMSADFLEVVMVKKLV
jgi:SAM-dependent methyltransferase